MRILSSGDWHVALHKKKVPYEWQENRFIMLFQKLHELSSTCDVHVISGDVFDKQPDTDETALVLSYLNSVKIPTILIPGNHSATKKGHSFWENFQRENAINNPLVYLSCTNERFYIAGQWFQTFPYGCVQTNKLPEPIAGDILVTHIRGEVPPHITAEYDFEKLRPWGLVLISDLHFNHKYKDYPIYYPGSPLNTTFDRDEKRKYGVDIIDFNSIEDYTIEFVDLKLPKLLRKTITVSDELVPDLYDHVIYEVTGSIDELAKINKSDLLDKKMVNSTSKSAKLVLKDLNVVEELELWLDYTKISDKDKVLNTYKGLGI